MCYLPERMTANSNNYDRNVPQGEGEIIISVVVTSTASSVTSRPLSEQLLHPGSTERE